RARTSVRRPAVCRTERRGRRVSPRRPCRVPQQDTDAERLTQEPAVVLSFAVRVLIDYRPALRQRSGVGEYTYQLIKALLDTTRDTSLELTVFSSSWKHRLDIEEAGLGGVKAVDCRVPVRLLNFSWHRLGW